MTEFAPPPPPPPLGYGASDGKRRANGPAIASLVCGILGCVPFLTGILAIVLGIVGLRKAREQYIEGKSLAIAGIVLGIISILGWGAAGIGIGYGYSESKPARAVAQSFLQDVSSGKINPALANSTGLTAAELGVYHTQLAPFGAFQSLSITGFNLSHMSGGATMHLEGTANFATGPHNCTFDLVKVGQVYKVRSSFVQ